jgi:hypothetical protein
MAIKVRTQTVRNNLTKYYGAVKQTAVQGMHVKVANDENRAKNSRPWTDRTGQARASITGTVEVTSDSIVGALAIGAYHGIFLEKANGGKYAIIWPTVLNNRRELLEVGRIALTSARI